MLVKIPSVITYSLLSVQSQKTRLMKCRRSYYNNMHEHDDVLASGTLIRHKIIIIIMRILWIKLNRCTRAHDG